MADRTITAAYDYDASGESLGTPPISTDPGERKKKAKLSPLMVAKAEAAGEKVNACPFGCQMPDLDDLGYCDHLVGFTTDMKTYEPMVPDANGMRRVQVPQQCRRCQRPLNTETDLVQEGKTKGDLLIHCPVCGKKLGVLVPDPPKLMKGDKLVQITSSYRVYRKSMKHAATEENGQQPKRRRKKKEQPERVIGATA